MKMSIYGIIAEELNRCGVSAKARRLDVHGDDIYDWLLPSVTCMGTLLSVNGYVGLIKPSKNIFVRCLVSFLDTLLYGYLPFDNHVIVLSNTTLELYKIENMQLLRCFDLNDPKVFERLAYYVNNV